MDNSIATRRKRTQRDYTMGFKLAVVDQVEKGQMKHKQAQRHCGIQGRSTVLVWLRKHGSLDWSPLMLRTMNSVKETPEQKIKRLEKELEDERTRNLIKLYVLQALKREARIEKVLQSNVRAEHDPPRDTVRIELAVKVIGQALPMEIIVPFSLSEDVT